MGFKSSFFNCPHRRSETGSHSCTADCSQLPARLLGFWPTLVRTYPVSAGPYFIPQCTTTTGRLCCSKEPLFVTRQVCKHVGNPRLKAGEKILMKKAFQHHIPATGCMLASEPEFKCDLNFPGVQRCSQMGF